MKITLIPERCIACGFAKLILIYLITTIMESCVFYDDPDQLEKEISPSQDVIEAIRNCPTRALIKDQH